MPEETNETETRDTTADALIASENARQAEIFGADVPPTAGPVYPPDEECSGATTSPCQDGPMGPTPNRALVNLLEQVLTMAKSGQLQGVALAGINVQGGMVSAFDVGGLSLLTLSGAVGAVHFEIQNRMAALAHAEQQMRARRAVAAVKSRLIVPGR